MSTGRVLLRNLMYLYTSVFCAGIQNIVTQLFFDRYYSQQKEVLLAVALFCGALCTMLGVMASARARRVKAPLLGLMITAVIGSFAGLFYVQAAFSYILLFSLASFAINFAYNTLDMYLTGTVPERVRELNVRVLLGYQMAGYLIAPLFFSVFASRPAACIALVLALGLASFVPSSLSYLSRGRNLPERERQQEAKAKGERPQEGRRELRFCFFMFMAVYIFLPSVAYMMEDYLKLPGHALVTSLFLGGTVLVSSGVILFLPAPELWRKRFLSPLIMAGALLLLLFLQGRSAGFLVLAALLSGLGYGMYLSGSRHYVNTGEESLSLVGRYNEGMTAASLLAYLLSGLIGYACSRLGADPVPVKFAMILLLLSVAAIAASIGRGPGQREG